MTSRTNTALYETERRWLFAAVTCLVITASCYIYFISASVAHVVMRKEVDAQIASLSSSVGALEAEYIEVQHAVSEDIATLRGFARTDTKIFIDKSEGSLSLVTQ